MAQSRLYVSREWIDILSSQDCLLCIMQRLEVVERRVSFEVCAELLWTSWTCPGPRTSDLPTSLPSPQFVIRTLARAELLPTRSFQSDPLSCSSRSSIYPSCQCRPSGKPGSSRLLAQPPRRVFQAVIKSAASAASPTPKKSSKNHQKSSFSIGIHLFQCQR